MAKKISGLPAVVTPADTDEYEINQGGTSYRVTRAQTLDAVGTRTVRLDLSGGNQDYTILPAHVGKTIVYHGPTNVPTILTDPTLTSGVWYFTCEEDVDQAWTITVDADSTVHVGPSNAPTGSVITLDKSSTYGLLLLQGSGTVASFRLERIVGNDEIGAVAPLDLVDNEFLDEETINQMPEDASPDGANDYVTIYDDDAAPGAKKKKVLLNNLPAGGGGTARTFAGTMTPDVAVVIYDKYTQSGALSFLAGVGTVTGSTHLLLFNSDGGALTWAAKYVAQNGLINANLPAALLAGWYTIVVTYHNVHDEFVVGWTKGDPLLLSGGTMTGNIGMADNDISRGNYIDSSEATQNPSVSSNALTLDFENGNVAYTTLGEDLTTLTMSNPPATGTEGRIDWEVTAGAFTITWPAAFRYVGGSAPTLDTGINRLVITTRDAGTNYDLFVIGLGVS